MILPKYRELKAIFGRLDRVDVGTLDIEEPILQQEVMNKLDSYTFNNGDIILPYRLALDNEGAFYNGEKAKPSDFPLDRDGIEILSPEDMDIPYVTSDTILTYIPKYNEKTVDGTKLEMDFDLQQTASDNEMVFSRATLLSKAGHRLATRCFEPRSTPDRAWYWNWNFYY